jgi:hypothetical protein
MKKNEYFYFFPDFENIATEKKSSSLLPFQSEATKASRVEVAKGLLAEPLLLSRMNFYLAIITLPVKVSPESATNFTR